MRLLRRIAVIGAITATLLTTALTGSAFAATGGGCSSSSSSAHAQACTSWITGSGVTYNTYINQWTPASPGGMLYQAFYYCHTDSVATPSTSCTKWELKSHRNTNPYSLGLQSGNIWSPSRTNHGVGFLYANFYDGPNGGKLLARVKSPYVYW